MSERFQSHLPLVQSSAKTLPYTIPQIFIAIVLAALLITNFVQIAKASGVSSAERGDFYSECFSSCTEIQLTSPENAILLDVPFVFDAYCSCFCTRMAMRITSDQLNVFIRMSLEGKDGLPDEMMTDLVDPANEMCSFALIN